MATDEELLVMFSQPGTTRREALRAVYNAGLSRAAEIIAASTPDGRDAFTPSVTFGRIIATIEAERDQA